MHAPHKITPCLWFDDQAEAAVHLYTSIFKNSKILTVSRYGKEGQEIHGKPDGTVMAMTFELDGQRFLAMNGGPMFKFTEAISLQVECKTQAEVDFYWEKLGAGGDEHAQQCGWLKDKFGLSWQVIPAVLGEMMSGPSAEKSGRAMQAMLQMKKLDIAALERAYNG